MTEEMATRTAQSLRAQIATLLCYTPHGDGARLRTQRLNWLNKKELKETLSLLNDYFLALHEAADLEAQGSKKTKACAKALEGAEGELRKINKIFAKAKPPKNKPH